MTIQEAVETATRHLAEVFPESAHCVLRVEGLERSDDEKYWKVMFSYPRDQGRIEPFYRDYRTVRLRDADGAFMGARNGLLSDAA